MDVVKRHGSSTAGLGLEHNTRTGDPWSEQAKYSKAVVTTISIVLLLAMLSSVHVNWSRYQVQRGRKRATTSAVMIRLTALARYFSYKRLPSRRLGCLNLRLPALGATLIMCLLMLGFTIWAFVVQPYYRDDRSFGSPPLALRSGMMALGLMPFIYVLGSKVNFIAMITGTSHEHLQVYHQWMARFMFFMATVHAIPFIYQPLAEGGSEELRESFFSDSINTTGVIAYACLFVLCFASATRLRERCYELFLIIHIPVAIVFLGYMFVHCQNLLTSWRYLWGTAAMYMLSVFLRFAGQLSKNSFLSLSHCEIEALPEQLTRLTIQSSIRWKAGQHVFVRFPAIAPWSAHPFTIVSMPSPDSHQLLSTIVLMAKAQDGLTMRLHQLAVQAQANAHDAEKKASLYAVIDGPYGQDADVSGHSHVLFLAGGSGITFVLASLLDLAWQWQQGNAATVHTHLIWSVRESGSLAWAKSHLQVIEALAPRDALQISLYLSGSIAQTNLGAIPESWIMHAGMRPDVGASIVEFTQADESAADEEKPSISNNAYDARSTAVVVCGPTSMSMDASNAIASVQAGLARGRLQQTRPIRLITEHFGW